MKKKMLQQQKQQQQSLSYNNITKSIYKDIMKYNNNGVYLLEKKNFTESLLMFHKALDLVITTSINNNNNNNNENNNYKKRKNNKNKMNNNSSINTIKIID